MGNIFKRSKVILAEFDQEVNTNSDQIPFNTVKVNSLTDYFMILGKNSSSICKHIKDARIDKKVGSFFGEVKDNLPHGKGIFVTWENKQVKEVLLQTFHEGTSRQNGRYIQLDPINGTIVIMIRTLKDRIAYDTGMRYINSAALPYYLKDGKECAMKEQDFPDIIQNDHHDEFFFEMGTDLENQIMGSRTVQYLNGFTQNGSTKGQYFGEVSVQTEKPHGRGIMLYDNGYLHINYWQNGDYADGKYIKINILTGTFWVDNKFTKTDEAGKKTKHMKGTRYDEDGTSELYSF